MKPTKSQPERLDVDRPVGSRLRGIEDDDRAALVRPGGQPVDRVDGPQRVGDVREREDLEASSVGQRVELVELQLALVIHGDCEELGAGASGDVLPGHEVGVVLHLGDEDDVARAEVVEPPRVGDEVDGGSDVPGEDHLARRLRIDEGASLLARTLEGFSRPLPEVVDPAVDVRVGGLVELSHRVENLARFLRRGRRVEVGERLPVDLLLEDGKIRAQLARVELGFRRYGHGPMVPRGLRLLRDARFESRLERRPHRLELDAVEDLLVEAAHDQALGLAA